MEDHLHEVLYKNAGITDAMLGDRSAYSCGMSNIGEPEPYDAATARAKGAPVGVKVYHLSHQDGLTEEQSNFYFRKLLSMHEFEASSVTSEDAKRACRVKDDEMDNVKKVAKFWKPVGEAACRAALSMEDFEELQNTILTSSMMDGEIASLMDRARVFFLHCHAPQHVSVSGCGQRSADGRGHGRSGSNPRCS